MSHTKSILLSSLLGSFVLFSLACKPEVKPNSASSTSIVSEGEEKVGTELESAEQYFVRAQQSYAAENYDGAISDLIQAITKDRTVPQYYHLLSDAYMDYYRSKQALMIMEDAAELFPERIPTLLKLSETQLILKQNEESLMTVAKIFNLDPNNAEGHFMKGMNFRSLGEVEKAIGAFQTTTELDPSHVDAWLMAGDLFLDKGQSLALDYYNAALSAEPDNLIALHSKAYFLQNNKQDTEAINLYQRIVGLDRNYTDAYLNTGILYMSMDSLAKAMEQFNIMAGVEPQNHLPYYYRGLIHEVQGNLSAARSDLQNAINLNPDFPDAKKALNNLGPS